MIELFDSICGHGWDNGVLMLRIKWKTDEESVMAFTMVKQDYPYETAEYYQWIHPPMVTCFLSDTLMF